MQVYCIQPSLSVFQEPGVGNKMVSVDHFINKAKVMSLVLLSTLLCLFPCTVRPNLTQRGENISLLLGVTHWQRTTLLAS